MIEELPLHRRFLDLQAFDRDDVLLLRGHLQDARPWQEDPTRVVVHDMTIELGVRRADLTIVSAEAGMSSFPHTECPLVTAQFGALVGLSVARGYTRSLREVFGGVTGCAHVYELARAAGAAAVQANLSYSAKHGRIGVTAETLARSLKGMCHIWSTDGVGTQKLAAGWLPGPKVAYPSLPLAEIVAGKPRQP